MLLKDIYPWYWNLIGEDVEAALKNADQAIASAQRRKGQAELTKARDSVIKKQQKLTDLNKPPELK